MLYSCPTSLWKASNNYKSYINTQELCSTFTGLFFLQENKSASINVIRETSAEVQSHKKSYFSHLEQSSEKKILSEPSNMLLKWFFMLSSNYPMSISSSLKVTWEMPSEIYCTGTLCLPCSIYFPYAKAYECCWFERSYQRRLNSLVWISFYFSN